MKKLSLLAVSMAAILAGCNSSSSSSGGDNGGGETEISGRFIDAAVEGMYYTTSSGKSGVTGVEGEFDATSTDTITFYIGGENGLKVGAASARDVLTPFEAAGKYNRALNLAILLQSIDNHFGTAGNGLISIPDELKFPDAETLEEIGFINLDSRATVIDFLDFLGLAANEIADETEALAHMEDAFGSMARGSDADNPFSKKDGKFVRNISVTQYDTTNQGFTFVHADKMLENELFHQTRGMSFMDLQLTQANLVILEGSNDTTFSSGAASEYLNCIASGGEFVHDSNGTDNECHGGNLDGNYTLTGNKFHYNLLNPYEAEEENLVMPWAEIEGRTMMPLSASTIKELNHYSAEKLVDDADEEDKDEGLEFWQIETASGSYDPVTGVYTEIMKKDQLSGTGCDQDIDSCPSYRQTESVSFWYEVDKAGEERYVDFKGTWEDKQTCDNGEVATMKLVFDATGATVSGTECNGNAAVDLDEESYTYAELADIDYWWFNQSGRESQATLTELNTVVRFCDVDDYKPGDACDINDQFFVKWEYQPAGTDWDEGLLIRTKMTTSGNIASTSSMQKISK
ncbi:hypothetical protein C9J01_28355 [Photobacterium rosenbergii]|uniref:Chromosome partitioning protein ParA n=1 Tax=Photobacterium rosenbergii TaxID=294936 RepID=A0A2T3MWD3_9GAMM|nr:hypothetical protein [Photobacterium rosenbergii]PSW04278.1 hypothetical protein C9J01_28355 [Photobacterium rosenbergii]